MTLRPRFLLLTAVFFLVVAVPSWFAVRSIAESIVAQWAMRYAEKQVLYDKSRTLQPILREVALAKQLASAEVLRRWARTPDDATAGKLAFAELESYRQNFQDKSYFVALLKNGHYFHNNASNAFAGQEFRYVLDSKAAKDAWFFDLIGHRRDLHINVNPDLNLGITKLWIDVLIRDGEDILGMVGTGLDLTTFINTVVEEHVPGVTSLFVDHAGAIQIHRDQKLIDFGSVSKSPAQQNTLQLLFDRKQDQAAVLAAMRSLEARDRTVATVFVNVNGTRHLTGVTYLPEIDWFEITLLDLDVLLPFSEFTGLLAVYGMTLVGLLILFNLAIRHYVLTPLKQLDKAMSLVEGGQDSLQALSQLGTGEIKHLMHRFVDMAQAVSQARRELESKVQERTATLEKLTRIDPMTELLNRRGMLTRLETELQRLQREGGQLGILWLDVDRFKEINDRFGHAAGDRAIKAIGRLIEQTVRAYDAVSRWGGDEFLVLLPRVNQNSLDMLGERLRSEIEHCSTVLSESGEIIHMSVSVGGHLQEANDTLDSLLNRGDQALFAAKSQQRNCYRSSVA